MSTKLFRQTVFKTKGRLQWIQKTKGHPKKKNWIAININLKNKYTNDSEN